MKKLLLFAVLIFGMATMSNAQGWWQKDKTYQLFVAGTFAPIDIKKGGSWGGFETGLLNKNTQFKGGITTSLFTKADLVYFVGVSRRLFTIGRVEPWIGISSGNNFANTMPLNFSPQAIARIQINKALNIGGGITKNWQNGNGWGGIQSTATVQVTLTRGHVHTNEKR